MRILPPDPGLLIVSCDGAARGNPGPAGIGVQITDEDGNVLAEIAEWIGETTNNVAEYSAALEGLRKAAGSRRSPRAPAVGQQAADRAARGPLQGEGVTPASAARGGPGADGGFRARAPPARPAGAEPRGGSAREPRRGPQGLGLGEPLTIPMRMDQVLQSGSPSVTPPGPRNVIRTVSPSAAAWAGNVTIPSTARSAGSERSDDVTSLALATRFPSASNNTASFGARCAVAVARDLQEELPVRDRHERVDRDVVATARRRSPLPDDLRTPD